MKGLEHRKWFKKLRSASLVHVVEGRLQAWFDQGFGSISCISRSALQLGWSALQPGFLQVVRWLLMTNKATCFLFTIMNFYLNFSFSGTLVERQQLWFVTNLYLTVSAFPCINSICTPKKM